MKTSFSKKLKTVLIVIAVCLVIAILSIFIGYRFISDTPEKILTAISEQTAMTINRLRQTATRNGLKEWYLDARSASLAKGGQEALLEDLTITFFTRDQKEIHLTAKKGILYVDSKNFELSGEIRAQNDQYRLQTDKLHYNHKDRIIRVTVPVEISGGGMRFTGEGMMFDLKTNRTVLEGNVEGILAFTP